MTWCFLHTLVLYIFYLLTYLLTALLCVSNNNIDENNFDITKIASLHMFDLDRFRHLQLRTALFSPLRIVIVFWCFHFNFAVTNWLANSRRVENDRWRNGCYSSRRKTTLGFCDLHQLQLWRQCSGDSDYRLLIDRSNQPSVVSLKDYLAFIHCHM